MAAEPLTTLSLESSIAQEAEAVDALPYIDGITAEERRQAEELIKEEVRLELPEWCTILPNSTLQHTLKQLPLHTAEA